MIRRSLICFLLAGGVVSHGDIVYLLDGSTREGFIESHNTTELTLRVEQDGISGTLVIPMTQINRAVIDRRIARPQPAPPPEPVTLGPAPSAGVISLTGAASPAPPPAPEASNFELILYRPHGFLMELAYTFAGHGLDDVYRLPASVRVMWERASRADIAGRRIETLEALRSLESAMRTFPHGMQRIDAITRAQRAEGFGVWMGRVHWQIISEKYSTGQFDLSDVRDVERPVIIGYLKEKTAPALDPLRTYFPPVDEKTGQYGAFKPAQLQGITSANALEVKEKATLAAAVLLAQLKLEPAMPAVD